MFVFGKKKNDSKFCPFAFNYGHKAGKCIKEECVFWNYEEQDCNINVIAKKLIELTEPK